MSRTTSPTRPRSPTRTTSYICAPAMPLGRHGRAADARHELNWSQPSCGTSGRIVFANERSANGNLPSQFRPEPFQPRQQPVVPNLKSVGSLNNDTAIVSSMRSAGNLLRFRRRTSDALRNFSGQAVAKRGVVGSGNFQDKIISGIRRMASTASSTMVSRASKFRASNRRRISSRTDSSSVSTRAERSRPVSTATVARINSFRRAASACACSVLLAPDFFRLRRRGGKD